MNTPQRKRRNRSSRRGGGTSPAPEPEAPGVLNADDPANDLVEPDNALPEIEFGDLARPLQEACARAGWTSLMPVQAKTIPYVLAGRDLMIQSRTGSGKTGAFLVPLIERIDPRRPACQALILVPTRELAQQVAREAEVLFGKEIRSVGVYGGVGYGPQIEAFKAGAHLVVGTPGRVLDHLLKRSLTLSQLEVIIFDEADRMLSMGFYPDMKRVQSYLPEKRINGYMFTATFPPHVMRLADQFLDAPEMLSLSRDHVHVADTEHVYYMVPDMKKDRVLARLIEIENPASAIIFCNTRSEVQYVSTVLQRFGYDADALSSDLSQKARDKVLTRVRKGQLRFLVATDVAARGIDIPELSHVFQFELPEDPEVYVHRAGRTGRAGASGEAISLVYRMEKLRLSQIAEIYKIKLEEREVPSDGEVADLVSQRVTALLEARLRKRNALELERMQRFVPLGRELAGSEDESAIVAMLLDDYYQQTLHQPLITEEPVEEAPQPSDSSSEQKPRRHNSRRGGRRGRP